MAKFDHQDYIVAGALLVFAVLMRVLPHLPNFSPMIAIAVVSGYYFRGHIMAWMIPLLAVCISDTWLGFYSIMPVVWMTYVVIAIATRRIMRRDGFGYSLVASIGAASLFFIVTNLAVWIEGALYLRTLGGLIDCFVAALPFFRASLMSTIYYTLVLFAIGRIAKSYRLHAGHAKEAQP